MKKAFSSLMMLAVACVVLTGCYSKSCGYNKDEAVSYKSQSYKAE